MVADTLLATKLDSLILQNHQNIETLSNAIISANNNQKVWNLVSYDTAFAVGATTVTLLLIEVVKGAINWCKTKQKKQEFRDFIRTRLKEITSYTEQIEHIYTSVSEKTTLDTGLLILPPQVQKSDFKIFLNIDSRELYNSFKEKDIIIKIYGETDTIMNLIELSETFHERLILSNSKNREEIKNLMLSFLDILQDMLEEMRAGSPNLYSQMDEYIFLSDKLNFYRKEIFKTNSILEFYNQFLYPTSEYIYKRKLYTIIKSGNEIIKVAKRFISFFRILDAETNDYKNQFVATVETILSQRKKIEDNIEKINW